MGSLSFSCLVECTGPGANAGEGAYPHQVEAATVAKVCLTASVKAEPKAGALWVNLANAYYVAGDHRKAKKCLEQVATCPWLISS